MIKNQIFHTDHGHIVEPFLSGQSLRLFCVEYMGLLILVCCCITMEEMWGRRATHSVILVGIFYTIDVEEGNKRFLGSGESSIVERSRLQ